MAWCGRHGGRKSKEFDESEDSEKLKGLSTPQWCRSEQEARQKPRYGEEGMARHDHPDFVSLRPKDRHCSHERRSGRRQRSSKPEAGKARPQTFRKHDMYHEKRMECTKLRLKQCR